MSKRYGRNKKRAHLAEIENLKAEVKFHKYNYDHLEQTINGRHYSNDTIALAILPEVPRFDIDGSPHIPKRVECLRFELNLMPLFMRRKFCVEELRMHKKYPQNLSMEISKAIEQELLQVMPMILQNVPE